jgi:hypothetical protein
LKFVNVMPSAASADVCVATSAELLSKTLPVNQPWQFEAAVPPGFPVRSVSDEVQVSVSANAGADMSEAAASAIGQDIERNIGTSRTSGSSTHEAAINHELTLTI